MRVIASALVTAIALFFFGFIWWGILMPIVKPAEVITDQAVVDSMNSTFSGSGVYFYPDPATASEATSGPWAILYFDPNMPDMGSMMGMGFGHMLLTAFAATLFVRFRNLPTFADRFKFVAGLGLFVALWADIGNMIWWHHPTPWAVFHFGYDLLSWVLAGAIIAAIMKPCPQKETSAT